MSTNESSSTTRALLHLLRHSLTTDTLQFSGNLTLDRGSALKASAIGHGLVPWLLVHLPHAALDALPVSLLSEWRTWEQQNRLRVLANWSVTSRVIGLLESTKISCMPVKGVALSQVLYGSPWMRPAGDVDLLLERTAMSAARRVMIEGGYSADFPRWSVTPRQWMWILDTGHSTNYRDRHRTLIELHWRLHDYSLLNNRDESWIKGPLRQIDVLGRKVTAFPEAIQYLLVMSHLARSRWSRLIWVLDSWLALQAARAVHTVDELDAIIADYGAGRIHHQFLELMRQLLENDALNQWPPPGFGTPNERMKSWGPVRRGWDGLLFHLGLKGSAHYKWSVLRGYLISGIDLELVRLPDWLFWLYVPLRIPLFVYRRYFQKSVGTVRAGKNIGFPPTRE